MLLVGKLYQFSVGLCIYALLLFIYPYIIPNFGLSTHVWLFLTLFVCHVTRILWFKFCSYTVTSLGHLEALKGAPRFSNTHFWWSTVSQWGSPPLHGVHPCSRMSTPRALNLWVLCVSVFQLRFTNTFWRDIFVTTEKRPRLTMLTLKIDEMTMMGTGFLLWNDEECAWSTAFLLTTHMNWNTKKSNKVTTFLLIVRASTSLSHA